MNRLIRSVIDFLRNHYKYIIYALGTIGICWIGVWRSIGNGAEWAFASNCLGFCIFPMIVCRFKLKDFLKVPYLLWIIAFSISAYPIFKAIAPGTDFNNQYMAAIANIGLYGLIVIRMYTYLLKEKSKTLGISSFSMILLVSTLSMFVVSRNETIWPLWYLVMFASIVLAPYDKVDIEDIVKGVSDGIIISFFWIQCRAFLYRPFDTNGRYNGHFTNPNVNAMFYMLSLAGLLSRLWYAIMRPERDEKGRRYLKNKIEILLLFGLSVSILIFVLFTGSRILLLAVVCMMFYWLCAISLRSAKKLAVFFGCGILIIIASAVLLYPVYACMRYIPPLRHHPVWYGDYSEEKIHSWDPIDSYKYTEFDEALENSAIGRVLDHFHLSYKTAEYVFESEAGFLFEPEHMPSGLIDSLPVIFKSTITIDNAIRYVEYPDGKWVYEYDDGVEPGSDEEHSAFIPNTNSDGDSVSVEETSTLGIRKYIWKYFLERMNLLGHREAHRYVYIVREFGHAHNSFIQIAFYFGLIAGILFLILPIYIMVYGFFKSVKVRSDRSFLYFFPSIYMTGFLVAGLLECLVFTGLMQFSMFFLAAAIMAMVEIGEKAENMNNSQDMNNPMEGKRVRLVECETDSVNADGIKGHLEEMPAGEEYPLHKRGFYEIFFKRLIDIVLSFVGLILLSPVFLFLSLAIVIDDPGPVFFAQKRIGLNKKYFKLHKFRSMKMSTPHDRPTHMLDNPEQYITKVGKFIRAHSLDELPQIWDIFIGNMSIIGPRPGLWNQDLLTAERDKYGANDVKPGLTGWAQINGRDELEIPDKAKLDGIYVEKLEKGGFKAFSFDVRCFFGTVFSVLRGDGVVEGGTGNMKKE